MKINILIISNSKTYLIKMHNCKVCQRITNNGCSKCQAMYYCCTSCQIVDWTFSHKNECKKMRKKVLSIIKLTHKLYINKPNTNIDTINNFVDTINSFENNEPIPISPIIRSEMTILNNDFNNGHYQIYKDIWNDTITDFNLHLLFD